jgi:hypothetical protein
MPVVLWTQAPLAGNRAVGRAAMRELNMPPCGMGVAAVASPV